MDFNEGMLRELHKNLGRLAVALVRTERGVTQMTQARRSPFDVPGESTAIRSLDLPLGRHPYWPNYYTGPVGGYYELRFSCVLTCWSPAGVHFRRQRHPDATEYIFVKSGEVVDLVSGRSVKTGNSYELAVDQTHEYFFPVDTEWVVVYALTDVGANDYAGDERGDEVGGRLLDTSPELT